MIQTTCSLIFLSQHSVIHYRGSAHKTNGDSFSDTIKKLKMEEAANLLIQTDDTIEKISEQAGYNSSDHFARTFRQYYGISPLNIERKTDRISS